MVVGVEQPATCSIRHWPGAGSCESLDGGRRITVALPVRTGPASALVEVAARPDLVAAASIVRDRIWVAAAWATLVGALAALSFHR